MLNKHKIFLKDKQLFIDKKPFIMFSGEIHYFRVPGSKWKMVINKAKAAGLNTISTYIPWRWHEYKEGSFDFTGITLKERNLIAFMDLVKKAGLYLSLRPGPMCHGEIIDDGLPGWLMDDYPQVRLKKPNGELFRGSMISLMHPDYLRLVSKWYQKVMPIISKEQITKGGNVILLQLDNEISMINWLTKIADTTHPALKGYRDYLKEMYGDIKEVNKRYKTKYKSFNQIKYPGINYDLQPGLAFWDWMYYWRSFYSEYFLYLSRLAQSYGIELPLIANIAHFADIDVRGRAAYSPMTTSMFREFALKVDNLILGGAYQMRRLDYENFHDIFLTSESVKMISAAKSPSFCVEMQSGIMFDRPVLYPADVFLNALTSLASGLNGFNAYMFASGINRPDMGGLGTQHNWQAAVALDGRERPHYQSLKRAASIIKTFNDKLSPTKKAVDVNIGFYLPYYETEFLTGNFISQLEAQRTKYFMEGLVRLLSILSISYKFIDIKNQEIEKNKPLIIFSLSFMDELTQIKIADFINGGGKVLIGPEIPTEGLDNKKAEVLRKKLKIKTKLVNSRYLKDGKNLYMTEEPNCAFLNKGKVLFKDVESNISALSIKCGRGKAVLYGFGVISVFNYYLDIMKSLIKELGIKQCVKSSSAMMPAVMRLDKDAGFLFVANYHQIPIEASYSIKLGGKIIHLPSKGTLSMSPRSGRVLPLNYMINEDITILSATVQILKISKSKGLIKLNIEATSFTNEEIVIYSKKRHKVFCNKKLIKVLEPKKRETINLVLENSLNDLIIK
jgi:beta-galactosidase